MNETSDDRNPADSHRLNERTWQDVERYIEDRDSPTVIVPIGSTEQHGPHLPLGVDAMQAETLAGAIAERAGALVAPTIPYGDADHHLGFPGTISLSTETTTAVLVDVYESLLGHGFRNVITVNGHRVANLTAIDTAGKRVAADHPEAFFATIDPLRFGVEIHTELRDGDPEDGMHGGEFETSFMQFHYPELVREEKFEPETSETVSRFRSNDLVGNDDRVLTPSTGHDPASGHLGHVGDPTHASPEKGEALFERLVEDGVAFIEALREEQA
jgi:creatinine amidohydrolase